MLNNPSGERIPLISPIILLLLSRKGAIWLVSAIVTVLIAYLPQLEGVRENIMGVLLTVFGVITSVLIGSIAYEDGKLKVVKPIPVPRINFVPIWSPILALLKSRKFIAAVVTVLVGFIVTNAPYLEPHSADLDKVLTVVIGLVLSTLIGAISHEDAASKTSPK